jgi:uncharacterized membrane protein YedE/YeeE
MDALHNMMAEQGSMWLAAGGLLLGLAFGAVVFRTNYCAMGSLADIHNFGDYRRFRAWILAAAVALVGAQLLQRTGVVALERSMYLGASINWFGDIVGGLIFGFGMVFAGGCPSRNLARAGSGDIRALITLVVVGIVAYMTIGGLFAPVRAKLEQATSLTPFQTQTQSIADIASAATGFGTAQIGAVLAVLIAGAATVYCLGDARFRKSPIHLFSGLAVGLIVVAGWALTGLTFDDMAVKPVPPISLTFVRPAGDTLEWLERYTAGPLPGFGASTVIGAIVGAFATALAMGRFQVATYSDVGDTVRNLSGAALMGIGGVMAMGCTVGQAITGVSTLALGSFLAFASIVAGGFYGLRVLERQILAAA